MLELAILGLLFESPVHGYELRKRLSVRLGGLRVISYGSLYPALRRLTRAGLIAEEAGPTAEGAWSRRGRRVYRITAEGVRVLNASLERYRALKPVKGLRGVRPARLRG